MGNEGAVKEAQHLGKIVEAGLGDVDGFLVFKKKGEPKPKEGAQDEARGLTNRIVSEACCQGTPNIESKQRVLQDEFGHPAAVEEDLRGDISWLKWCCECWQCDQHRESQAESSHD